MLSASVDALADQTGCERTLTRYFEIWLLRLAGLFPDFRACADCGLALETTAMTTFDVEMRPLCDNCSRVDASVLTPEAIKIIRVTHQLSPIEFVRQYSLTDRQYAEIGGLTHRMITRAIERRPRTLLAATR